MLENVENRTHQHDTKSEALPKKVRLLEPVFNPTSCVCKLNYFHTLTKIRHDPYKKDSQSKVATAYGSYEIRPWHACNRQGGVGGK